MNTKGGTARKTAPKPKAAEPKAVGIGDTVLFRIDATIVRPLIVAEVRADGVLGTVVTQGEADSGAAWISANCFYRPSVEDRNWLVFLKEPARQGDGVGEWQPR